MACTDMPTRSTNSCLSLVLSDTGDIHGTAESDMPVDKLYAALGAMATYGMTEGTILELMGILDAIIIDPDNPSIR